MADPGPSPSIHTWIGIEEIASIETFERLDISRLETIVTTAISGVSQQGGTLTSVGLAPFVLPDDGVFVLAWVVWQDGIVPTPTD